MRLNTTASAVACALVSCFASGMAHAEDSKLSTTVYGIIGLDYVNATNVYDSASGKSFSKSYIDNSAQSASRLGFKGSHKINPDLEAFFGIEAGLSADTGGTSTGKLFNRGTVLGLKGKFGTVSGGRQWNLNDDSICGIAVCGGYAIWRYSEFGDTSNLYDNSLKYYTPNFGGFQASMMVGAGEAKSSADGGNMFESKVTYASGPFNSMLSYHESKDSTGTKTDRLVTGGVGLVVGPVKGRLAYVSAHYPSLPSNASGYDIGLDYTVSQPLVLSFDYVTRDKKKSPDDTKYFRVRAVYAIDSAVSVNANFVYLNNKGAATQAFYGDGQAGQNQRLIGVGMAYTF